MRRFMEWVVDHPVLALLLSAVLTAAAAGGLPQLRIDASARGLLVPGSPDQQFYDEARATFGDDVILSVVLQAEDVFRSDLLTAIQDLTLDAGAIDGISRVVSLATVSHLEGAEGFLNTDDLLAYVPEDAEELATLRRSALGNELLLGEVVSRDGGATAVHLFLEARPQQIGFEEGVVAEVEALLDGVRQRLGPDVEVYQVGNPYLKQSVMTHIRRDLLILAPTCTLAILVVLFFVFRSIVATVLPAVTGLLSVVVTLGVMGYLDVALTPVTVMIPSLLIIIGCTEDIHLVAEYALELRAGHGRDEAVRAMARKSGLAVLLTSLTTFIGFATIVPNDIPMLSDFGSAAALGILVNFVITVLVVPALLRLAPAPAALSRPEKEVSDGIKRFVLGAAVKRPGRVLGAAALLVVVFVFGATRLLIDTNYLAFFRDDSEVRQLYRDVSENLVGALSFLVVVDTGDEGGVQDPRVLRDVAALTDFLSERFDKVLGYPDYLRKLHQEINAGDPAHHVIPESRELISQLELMLDPDDLDRFTDFDRRRTAILVRTSVTGSKQLGDLVREIDAFAAAELSRDLDVHVTGESILIAQASDTIARELLFSLTWVLVAIFAFISLLFYSLKAGLLAMVPNLLPVLVNFGFMGLAGIPLSTATFPVAMIALGIAVDDTIHFMVRFAGELKKTSDNEKALTRTIVRELRPVLTTSVALAIGFSTLLFGQFASTVHFGLLAALAMGSALLADLFVTPVLLKTTPLISAWDLLRLKISDRVMARSPLFQGLRRGEVKRVALLGDLRRHRAGDYILRQNDEGDDLVVLLSGTARIEVRDEEGGRTRELNLVEAGDVVGEMAFFTKGKRSASVIACEDVESLQVDGRRLGRIQARFPRTAAKVYYNLSKLLSTRLGQATVWLTRDA